MSCCLFSGSRSEATVPSGSASKAAFVGAKTVFLGSMALMRESLDSRGERRALRAKNSLQLYSNCGDFVEENIFDTAVHTV